MDFKGLLASQRYWQTEESVKRTGTLLISVTMLAVSVCAQSDSDAAVRLKIIALEQLWNQAYKSGDVKALDSILDDTVVLVNDDGSMQTKAEFLASVKSSISQPSAQRQQVAPESLAVNGFGKVGVATGVMRGKGVENGKPYTRRERLVDTWLKRANHWVCVATNATPVLH
jgi:ketosteroid isomerase-like protein